MRSLNLVIGLVSIYLLVYAVLCSLTFNWSVKIALMLFSLSPLLVIWMVIRVLRDDYKYRGNFKENFYQDLDYKRNQNTGLSQ